MLKKLNTSILTKFSFNDSLWLKGLAITMIFIHNFCHVLPGSIKENEFTFSPENGILWWENLTNGGPHILMNLFAYLGHYGVPIFLFLSGYGLVCKYESAKSQPQQIVPFMKYNMVKMWKLLVVGMAIYLLADYALWHEWRHDLLSISAMLTFTANLIPAHAIVHHTWYPWWFFSLIIQCYLLYILFFYKRSNKWIYWAIAASLLVQVAAIAIDRPYTLHHLRLNVTGWVLPFSMGILMARRPFQCPIWLSAVSVLLIIAGGYNIYLWLFTPAFVILGMIPLLKIKNTWIRKSGIFIGVISSYIFLLHPIIRPYFILPQVLEKFSNCLYLIALAYIAACLLAATAYQKINQYLKKK